MSMIFILHQIGYYTFTGFFSGLIAGLLGIGGGLVVVPGLLFVFQQTQIIPEQINIHVATGTSLAVMILTSQASLRIHYKLGKILWSVFNKLCPGIITGTLVGALIASRIPKHYLERLFALFLFFVAIKMLMDIKSSYSQQAQRSINPLISFLIGLKSGILGIGGGILIIPYLAYCGVPIQNIAAISNLCTLTVALVGSIIFIITGWVATKAIPYATGYIYWPAVLLVAIPSSLSAAWGAKLHYKLPINQLKYAFILILIVTAIKMT